jgi:hypothetical protein
MNLSQLFQDIASAIIQYLQRFQKSNNTSDAFAFTAMRVLTIWLAEDTEKFRDELYDLLPFLILQKPSAEDEFIGLPYLCPIFEQMIEDGKIHELIDALGGK